MYSVFCEYKARRRIRNARRLLYWATWKDANGADVFFSMSRNRKTKALLSSNRKAGNAADARWKAEANYTSVARLHCFHPEASGKPLAFRTLFSASPSSVALGKRELSQSGARMIALRLLDQPNHVDFVLKEREWNMQGRAPGESCLPNGLARFIRRISESAELEMRDCFSRTVCAKQSKVK